MTDAGNRAGDEIAWKVEVLSKRACAWPRRMAQGPARLIGAEELRGWVLFEDERLLVINKPGDVVCHPSKAGPWSSLAGAVRECFGLAAAHLVFRLDRETSGVVVFAKDAEMAKRLQGAMQERKVRKSYRALLTGRLAEKVTVDQPLGDDVASPVFVKSTVREDGQRAVSHFSPLAWSEDGAGKEDGGFTLARVVTETGRKHQIRAHAQWLGHWIAGDKIYGPDARWYLEFIDHGWTPAMAEKLFLPRQALHCAEIDLREAGVERVFTAPLAEDLREFCAARKLGI
ncbi:MAG TPA: RluA family pseudouridine synthase [Opitutus sp.]|nr:RluA family pseudouridine synthase [Opitutus sp.]